MVHILDLHMGKKKASIEHSGGNEIRMKVITTIKDENRVSLEGLIQKVSPDGKLNGRVKEEADWLAMNKFVEKRIEGGDMWYVAI